MRFPRRVLGMAGPFPSPAQLLHTKQRTTSPAMLERASRQYELLNSTRLVDCQRCVLCSCVFMLTRARHDASPHMVHCKPSPHDMPLLLFVMRHDCPINMHQVNVVR